MLRISGGNVLRGTIKISGSKNAALACLAASILTNEPVTLENLPSVRDTKFMIELLRLLDAKVKISRDVVTVESRVPNFEIPSYPSNMLRGSILLLGPLLVRRGRVRISAYGGCPIGQRPINFHLSAFEALGAKVKLGKTFIEILADTLRGAEISFPFPSVGATENAIMAACMAEGRTVLRNVALEPEVLDLIKMLQSMGVNIEVNNVERKVTVVGNKDIGGTRHKLIPDRIEAGTYAVAATIAGEKVLLQELNVRHLEAVIQTLIEMGVNIEMKGIRSLKVNLSKDRLKCARIETSPFPGFPTDMQPQFTTLCTQASGSSYIVERIYESRFNHVPELRKMGAEIHTIGREIVVKGYSTLHGAKVQAKDIRGGAALVLAALIARGTTIIEGAEIIERGYEDIAEKLRCVGAEIEVLNNASNNC